MTQNDMTKQMADIAALSKGPVKDKTFVAAAMGATLPKNLTLVSDEEPLAKVAAYANTGGGKSYLIAYLIKMGYKVAVFSTDMGGEGTRMTVRAALADWGMVERAKTHLIVATPPEEDFDMVVGFTLDPFKWWPALKDFDTDWLVWEGYTNFQANYVEEWVTGKLGIVGPKEQVFAEDKGDSSAYRGWNQIKKGTVRPLARFLLLRDPNTGKAWHKYVTFMHGTERQPKKKASGASQKVVQDSTAMMKAMSEAPVQDRDAPLIQGSAQKVVPSGFDLVLNLIVTEKPDGKAEYLYRTTGTNKTVAKQRGAGLDPEVEADFEKLWRKVAPRWGIEIPD